MREGVREGGIERDRESALEREREARTSDFLLFRFEAPVCMHAHTDA